MEVSLTVVGGKHKGREIPIRLTEFLIGRDAKCNLRPASPDVGREHCALRVRKGHVFLRDFGSRAGTLLNGRRLVSGELQLEDGDLIEVGPLTFRLNLGDLGARRAVREPQIMDEDQIEAEIEEILNSPDMTNHGEPMPEDTLQVAVPRLPSPPPVVKRPRDEDEVLCLEP
jgi:pSer/pThr/pTyr-binding forkhead associated (FHA) protein